jgi:hypothetical protein
MRNRYFFILIVELLPLLFFFSQHSKAQEYQYQLNIFGAAKLMEEIYKIREPSIKYLSYNDIEGCPYLSKEFIKGEILTYDSTLYTDIDLRYDAYNETMQIHYKDEILILDNTINIIYVKIQNQYFYNFFYYDNNKIINAYFKLLVDDSCSLFARYKVKFYEKEESNGFNKPKPARFSKIYCSYYIKCKKDITPLPVKNKKQFLNNIADNGEMEAFINKEKLKFNNEDDLVKIINHYNFIKF